VQNTKLKANSIGSQNKKVFWENFTNDQLLNLRFCDLDLSINNAFLDPLLQKVEAELNAHNILIKPHFWLSDEWFTPDGIPGIAIPFYLAQSRLTELERNQMGFAEGETGEWCLKILRHELGHVIDNAFELRRKKIRQMLFGKASTDYPDYYTYKPYSKRFVQHIEEGYAQSHPAEDFAETFAVWLDPNSDWKKQYKKWPALKKLNYMESLMSEIAGQEPQLKNKILIDPIQAMRKTLRSHYYEKKTKWGIFENDKFFDPGLLKVFSNSDKFQDYPNAEAFFSSNNMQLCKTISEQSGYPQYTVQKMLDSVVERTKKLGLKLVRKEMTTKKYICYYLSMQIKAFISEGRHLISL